MTDATEQPLDHAVPILSEPEVAEVQLRLSDVEAGLASLPRAKVARAISLGGSVLVIAMIAYRWQEGKDRSMLLVIGLAILALFFVNRNPARKIAKRVYDSLPPEARRIGVSVNDEGIRLRSSGAESELAWSSICDLVETRDVVVVFLSRENAQILPKRAFTDAQLLNLRTLAKQHIVKHDERWLTPALQKRLMVWTVTLAAAWSVWYFFGRR